MMTVFRKSFIVANTHFSKPVETLTCSGDLRASTVNQPLLFSLHLLKLPRKFGIYANLNVNSHLILHKILFCCELNYHLN